MWSFLCLTLKCSACPSYVGFLTIFRTWASSPSISLPQTLLLDISPGDPTSLKGFFICSLPLYTHHVLVPLLTVCRRNTQAKSQVMLRVSGPQRLQLGLRCAACTSRPWFFLVSCSILTLSLPLVMPCCKLFFVLAARELRNPSFCTQVYRTHQLTEVSGKLWREIGQHRRKCLAELSHFSNVLLFFPDILILFNLGNGCLYELRTWLSTIFWQNSTKTTF